MKVGIGSDHAGFHLKHQLREFLQSEGHSVVDVGAYDERPSDYPDVAKALAPKVATGEVERGILLCGSGVGVSIAANKFAGIRAGVCHDCYSARQGVEHDDMNVLVLGARVVGLELAKDLTNTFLNARFSLEQRHLRRLRKVESLE